MSDHQRDLSPFYERMNSWVASQGLVFQLSHGSTRGGLWSSLLTLLFRVFLLAIIVAAFFWVVALKRGGSELSMSKQFETQLTGYLGAKEVNVESVQRAKGNIVIDNIVAIGGEGSYFDELSVRGFRCKKSRMSDLTGDWNPGKMTISALSILVRSGADSDEEAKAYFDSLFQSIDALKFEELEVSKLSLGWGYGKHTKGSILDTEATITKPSPGQWEITCEGGTISQVWLENAQLETLKIIINQESGISFSDGLILLGEGSIKIEGKVAVGAIPQLSGDIVMVDLPIKDLLPQSLARTFQGEISGEGTLSGSPNASSGIQTSAKITLNSDKPMYVRSDFPLVQALKALDTKNSYHKVNFTEGSFVFDYKGGGVELSDIDITAPDLISVKGAVSVRRPSGQEIAESTGRALDDIINSVVAEDAEDVETTLSLEDAGKVTFGDALTSYRGGGNTISDLTKSIKHEEIATLSRRVMAHGKLIVSLQPEVFSEKPVLQELYPLNDLGTAVELTIPLSEPLDQATQDFANDLIKEGSKK